VGLRANIFQRIQTAIPDLNRLQDQWIAAFNPLVTQQTQWITVGTSPGPGFSNGWGLRVSNDTQTPQFTLDLFGFVLLRGDVAGGTVGQPAFTLPVGYRPSRNLRFAVVSNGAFGDLRVSTDGTVTLLSGSNVSVFLDNIRFLAEA